MSRKESGCVPRVRFPEFGGTGCWYEETIGSICETYSGGTPQTAHKEYYGGNIPFIRSAEIDLGNTELFLTDSGLKESSAKLIEKGDVLVALYGANSGEVALAKINGAINQAILCLKSRDNNSFVYQYLLRKKDDLVSKYVQGGQGNLSGEIVKSFAIYYPSAFEQQKIADCLTSLDNLIAAENQKLDSLKVHKKGLMQNLFPAEGESVPKVRFPEFLGAGDWVEKRLADISDYTKGFAFKSKDYASQGIRIIRVSDLGSDFIKTNNEQLFISKQFAPEYDRYKLFTGDIIVTTVGSKPELKDSAVGRLIYVPSDNKGLLNQNLLKLNVYDKINSKFLFLNMNTSKYLRFISSISRGNANQANIAVKELFEFTIMLPPPPEQAKIATTLTTLDNLITAQSQKIAALKSHKKGLMQQLFPAATAGQKDDKPAPLGHKTKEDHPALSGHPSRGGA